MLSFSFSPPDFVIPGIIPIHKGARVALTESDSYRGIAIE